MSTTMQNVSIGKKPNPVTLTDGAAAKVAELLAQEDAEDLALRVAVRPGGCSGFSYEMFFDTDVAEDDVVSGIRHREGRRGPDERRPAEGFDPRLQRRAPGRGFPRDQPQRNPDLRLRLLLQLIR